MEIFNTVNLTFCKTNLDLTARTQSLTSQNNNEVSSMRLQYETYTGTRRSITSDVTEVNKLGHLQLETYIGTRLLRIRLKMGSRSRRTGLTSFAASSRLLVWTLKLCSRPSPMTSPAGPIEKMVAFCFLSVWKKVTALWIEDTYANANSKVNLADIIIFNKNPAIGISFFLAS